MFTELQFWKAVGERAVRTFAQALVASLTVVGFTTTDVNSWTVAVTTAAFATLLSVLTSVAAAGVGPTGPSFGPETVDPAEDLAELDPEDPELVASLRDPDEAGDDSEGMAS